jgi:hypothetical protein
VRFVASCGISACIDALFCTGQRAVKLQKAAYRHQFAATCLKFAARLCKPAAVNRPWTLSPSTGADFLGYPIRASWFCRMQRALTLTHARST